MAKRIFISILAIAREENFAIAVLSTLYLPEDDIDQLILAGKYDIPTGVVIMPSVGSVCPITLAGTLAQGNAELLGPMTLAQVSNPGHPIPYFYIPTVTGMILTLKIS